MSINLHLSATKKGSHKEADQHEEFNLWQTPTQLTYEILNDTDSFKCPVDIDGIPERYKDFVNEKSKDEVGKFYQPHTLIANEHLNELKAWLFRMKEQDFKVSWRMG